MSDGRGKPGRDVPLDAPVSVCAYCSRPLECEGCRTPFVPADPAQYEALHRGDIPVECPVCETILVCRWCQTPYDGRA